MEAIKEHLNLIKPEIEAKKTPEFPKDFTTLGKTLKPYDCEACSDTGYKYETRDGINGVVRCDCRARIYREAALSKIPPKFGRPVLSTLTARNDLHAKQKSVIQGIQANPDDSYFFFGDNGVGKTHLAWSLYSEAAMKNRYVVSAKLDELLIEYRRFELSCIADPENTWRPRIMSEKLKQRSHRWLIFLDELEKSTPTEFAAKRLFALVDAIQEYDHQLICTSNLEPRALQKRWSREDDVWGSSIARRIAQTCTLVDFTQEYSNGNETTAD